MKFLLSQGFLIHGKLSKKSKQVYRVRGGRQQLYTLKHVTPNSPAQLSNQAIFGKVSAIVNRIFKDPNQAAHWEQIATTKNFPTARKAAYAHYKAIIISQHEEAQQQPQKQNHQMTISPSNRITESQSNRDTEKLSYIIFITAHTIFTSQYKNRTNARKIIQGTFEQL